MLDNRDRYVLLLDYYGDLMTNHQVEILNEYFNEDLSMNEIAENYQISKSAVQDLIKRTIKQLDNYEKCLKMVSRDDKLGIILDEMKKEENPIIDKYIKKLKKL